MDRVLLKQEKKQRWFKPFEWMDLIPYTIALVMLLMQLYILLQFIKITEGMQV
jgi:hypothetical protein